MAYCSVTSTPQRFANCLTSFEIHDLLVLKKSMESMREITEVDQSENHIEDSFSCNDTFNEEAPQRMALMAAERSSERGTSGSGSPPPWQSDHAASWIEEKPSKLQTLFQISITALAFLSFGGYLLCLIVQAIKSKGTTYFHPVATATTTSTNGNVKRIKIYRRSKRSTHPDPNRDPHSKHIPHLLFADYATYMNGLRGRRLGNAHLVGS